MAKGKKASKGTKTKASGNKTTKTASKDKPTQAAPPQTPPPPPTDQEEQPAPETEGKGNPVDDKPGVSYAEILTVLKGYAKNSRSDLEHSELQKISSYVSKNYGQLANKEEIETNAPALIQEAEVSLKLNPSQEKSTSSGNASSSPATTVPQAPPAPAPPKLPTIKELGYQAEGLLSGKIMTNQNMIKSELHKSVFPFKLYNWEWKYYGVSANPNAHNWKLEITKIGTDNKVVLPMDSNKYFRLADKQR